MKPPINESSARQRSGEPSPVRDRNGNRNARPRSADIAEVGRQIAELVDLSTQELRVDWRQSHRTGPPPGLSRDLLIRALAHQLQERTYGGVSLALQRRLRTLSAEFEKGASCSASRIMLKTGATLVRQWGGRIHTVLVRENRFEYEGQHYRSLTVIAEKIIGAHWSGPRFFGLTRLAGASVVEVGR
jgi:Protein of unknown function (DUF2924)